MNLKCLVLCFSGLFCLITNAQEKREEKTVRIGEVVASGYLFYDGKYLDTPYSFTRKGFSVFVNEKKIYFQEAIIKYLLPNRDKNVDIKSIPKDITYEEFTNPEKPWGSYEGREIKRILKSNSENRLEKVAEFYKTLPFIKNAIVIKSEDTIEIITFKGDKTGIYIGDMLDSNSPSKPPPSKLDVEKMLEKELAVKLQNLLKNGGCIFLFSDYQGTLNISSEDVKNNLPEIIKVFGSKSTDNVKKNKLYRLRLYPKRKFEKADFLVKNFKENKELKKRIDDILVWRKETGFKRKKIENEPTKEELQVAQEKAAKNADKKWREENPERYKKFLAAQKLYFSKKQEILKKGREGYWKNRKQEHEEAIKQLNKLGADYYKYGRR